MVFGLTALTLVGVLALALLFEVVLFWAAASLADAPEAGILKCGLVGLLVVAICGPVTAIIFFLFGMLETAYDTNRWVATILAYGLSIVAAWALPSVLLVPIVPVSLKKGMFISVLQLLLRIFLWVLVVAVAMVALAVVQIVRGPTETSEAPGPRVVLVRAA
jgi:hypothetical protein